MFEAKSSRKISGRAKSALLLLKKPSKSNINVITSKGIMKTSHKHLAIHTGKYDYDNH